MLNWAFGSKGEDTGAPPAPPYEEAKRIVESGSTAEQATLASCSDVPPEFLYYFATEGAADVKAVVAGNRSTPLQADVVLAEDTDDSVREILAGKIGEKAAGADPEGDPRSTGMVHQILGTLAKDQLPAVRGIISDAIRTLDNVPKPIVAMLARDVDELVASPVLEFSPLLSDAELAAMVGDGMGGTALRAVARREGLGESTADAVAGSGNIDAIATMLENETANIGAQTFDQIASLAETEETLHAPMVGRADLPDEAARKIASFVSDALLDQLSKRNDLDAGLRNELRAKISAQLAGGVARGASVELNDSEAIAAAYRDVKAGRIPAHKIMRSLNKGDYTYVIAAMALMSGVPHQELADAVLRSDTRVILAVAWKCGFDPYMTETIQRKLPPINDGDVMAPNATGGFPLPVADMDLTVNAMRA